MFREKHSHESLWNSFTSEDMDSSESTPPVDAMGIKLKNLYPKVDQKITPIPRLWNGADKFDYIGLSNVGLRIQYKLHGDTHREGGSVRANYTIPPSTGIFYFEVKILGRGREGGIAIGLATKSMNLSNMPGMDRHSFGYHGVDGRIHSMSRDTKEYGPSFSIGDVIGCGVNFSDNTCFYTKNGHNLGIAFWDLPKNLYPTVGLQTVGGVVDTNFGQDPFLFDLEDLMKEMRAKAKLTIDNYEFVRPDSQHQETMHDLVLSYLVHNGYIESAHRFATEIGQECHDNNEGLHDRQKIMKLIMAGRIQEAIDMSNNIYPGVLDSHPDLYFRLKCRQFIEILTNGSRVQRKRRNRSTESPVANDAAQNGNETNGFHDISNNNIRPFNSELTEEWVQRIVELGIELKSYLNHANDNPDNATLLSQAFSLMAYNNPKDSPLAWLLQPSERESVSDELNHAILKSINRTPKPPLEMAIAHLQQLLPLLANSGIGLASFINLEDYLHD